MKTFETEKGNIPEGDIVDISFGGDIEVDTSSMIGKRISINGKPYIVDTSTFNWGDSPMSKSITAVKVKVETPPIPQNKPQSKG